MTKYSINKKLVSNKNNKINNFLSLPIKISKPPLTIAPNVEIIDEKVIIIANSPRFSIPRDLAKAIEIIIPIAVLNKATNDVESIAVIVRFKI